MVPAPRGPRAVRPDPMDQPPLTTILPLARPPKPRSPSRVPVLKTIFYTLHLSMHFLTLALLRRFTLEKGDRMLFTYARRIFASGNAQLLAGGREHFEPGRPYVVMSNHRSLLDIPALFAATPGHLRMVLKEELLRVPIWGAALKHSGFIPVNRKNTARAIEQIGLAKKRLADGISVWIAPEGTRCRDGKLHRFKKGGFHLASQLGIPIVPAWIEGTDTVVSPHQMRVHFDGTATVLFGPPIASAGVEVTELAQRVRHAILELARRVTGQDCDAGEG